MHTINSKTSLHGLQKAYAVVLKAIGSCVAEEDALVGVVADEEDACEVL